ncbi:S9 family peptidase [Actinobacteria bacterium YIM 96077]|uniref:S9 family peptidase n=1 Tax=Phytoactinopolyspora halophila TaxID=1981511 RepID=A0A329QW48_9ACTN|nr:S9 family peptidase [Phytoactinopolyspora halophila]AYY12826.1 S9 family peptidase [Actinobacteria bacterium YIM 96077]RAW16381.1 S9 family peptidase [Phytoactinopolyspora halophila]
MSDEGVPLIPRDVLFGNPERLLPSLSPDGTRLGFVAPDDGVLNVWVGPADDPAAARPVTFDRGRGIRIYDFCHDDRTLVYLQDTDGDEDWRLYALDLETGEAQLVTPQSGVTAGVLAHNRWHPTTMLVALNADDPALHDVYRLDLTSREIEKIETNPGYAAWMVDSDLRIRGGVAMTEDGGAVIYLRNSDTGADEPWLEVGPDDTATTGVYGFSRDGQTVYLLSSIGANSSRLLAVDLSTGEETVLAEDPNYDVAGVAQHPETLEPQGVSFLKERKEWLYLDPEFGAEVDHLRSMLRGEIGISRPVRDGHRWMVHDLLSDGPIRYYIYERGTRELTFLFSHRPELEQYQLAEMEPFSYTARDGLTIHGYLTVPVGAERRDLPAVLNVHGGPWARDTWGYDPEAQWFANRGYVCVQGNFRGSSGYGKAFGNAGDKQWGKAMHTDLIDAVDYLAGRGWIDRERVGIYGGSYGGYAALAGAAFTPDVFRCAVDLVGPSNLLTLLSSIPEYWKPQLAFMHKAVGNPDAEKDLLWEASPLSRVDDIRIPILVAQGKNDPRVKEAEAEQIVNALAEKNLDHEYLLFEDEGHGLAKPENRERFYAAAEAFLAQHLGGRYQS